MIVARGEEGLQVRKPLPAGVKRRGHLLFDPSLIREFWRQAVEHSPRPPRPQQGMGEYGRAIGSPTVQRRTRMGWVSSEIVYRYDAPIVSMKVMGGG
jgi:hypothetical protein